MQNRPTVLDRFLSYVRLDTQSTWPSSTRPSTPGQIVLLRQLVAELQGLGLRDVELDDGGIVMATLPSNLPEPSSGRRPVVGFVAHVDTSPEYSGSGVNPQLVRDYQGGDIVLDERLGVVIREDENPHLLTYRGHDIVTTDGTTLLGADDKAGVAEIMDLLTRLVDDPTIPHAEIRVAFTPDEEIGRGVDTFDVERFGVDAAYTVDGTGLGIIEDETFSADGATIEIEGRAIHTAIAYGRMVNALQVAAALIEAWPADERPETTRGREGFVYFYQLEGTTTKALLRALVRDFDPADLERRGQRLLALCNEVERRFPGSSIKVVIEEQYRNMKQILDEHPHVVELACEAMRRAGIEPKLDAVRGGTDGSRLTFMGVPTPNLFNGCHNYHSPTEHVSVQVMNRAVDALVELVQLWSEPRSESSL
ncbi:MAG: peptidase T [Myxococcales bacterium]|nr:peptidase T [Myxococcales bacterium]